MPTYSFSLLDMWNTITGILMPLQPIYVLIDVYRDRWSSVSGAETMENGGDKFLLTIRPFREHRELPRSGIKSQFHIFEF